MMAKTMFIAILAVIGYTEGFSAGSRVLSARGGSSQARMLAVVRALCCRGVQGSRA